MKTKAHSRRKGRRNRLHFKNREEITTGNINAWPDFFAWTGQEQSALGYTNLWVWDQSYDLD